jgi:hypothetical protein
MDAASLLPVVAMSTAARIAEALTGRKVQAKGGNYLVCCPAHDDDIPSLSLRDGDSAVMVHCFAGCSPGDIFAAIRRKDRKLLETGQTAPQPIKGTSEYGRRQHEKAAWMWGRRRPISGTVAETYLHEVRRYTGLLPPTLAFLPPLKPEHHPALIAAFSVVAEPEPGLLGKPQQVTAVHLTLLKSDGSGKADTHPNKITIGSPVGRPIVLAPPNDLLGLAICEGIEDALTAYQATGLGAWAAGAAGFMPKLAKVLPSYIEAVTIFAHSDAAGERNARQLATALRQRGIEVRTEGLQ